MESEYSSSDSSFEETRMPTKTVKQDVKINVCDTKYAVVRYVAKQMLGWKLVNDDEDDTWDVWWSDSGVHPQKLAKMKPYQKINHWPGMHALARKNQLGRHLMQMAKNFPKQYNYFPKTFMLPAEASSFRAAYSSKKWYIVKPEASCQGRGIFLATRFDDIEPNERYVAQEYIKNPYLIDGLKCDFRIYVLVVGFDPLRVYIHEDGLTRFATHEYEIPNRQNMHNMCMHLTNYAVNKRNPNFDHNEEDGHKRSLAWTYSYLQERGHNINRLKKRINDMIIKTLCTVQPSISHTYRSCQSNDVGNRMWFEILGLDVLLDYKLKPYLIEVNQSPSFTTDSALDKTIKRKVIFDALTMMNVTAKERKACLKQKQKETIQRTLTGRHVKKTKDQLDNAKAKELAKCMKFEEKHKGGFTRIYPLEKNEEYYQNFIQQSDSIWQSWTGAKPRTTKDTTPNGKKTAKDDTKIDVKINKLLSKPSTAQARPRSAYVPPKYASSPLNSDAQKKFKRPVSRDKTINEMLEQLEVPDKSLKPARYFRDAFQRYKNEGLFLDIRI